jgi:hypothetical protein
MLAATVLVATSIEAKAPDADTVNSLRPSGLASAKCGLGTSILYGVPKVAIGAVIVGALMVGAVAPATASGFSGLAWAGSPEAMSVKAAAKATTAARAVNVSVRNIMNPPFHAPMTCVRRLAQTLVTIKWKNQIILFVCVFCRSSNGRCL